VRNYTRGSYLCLLRSPRSILVLLSFKAILHLRLGLPYLSQIIFFRQSEDVLSLLGAVVIIGAAAWVALSRQQSSSNKSGSTEDDDDAVADIEVEASNVQQR
jgi:hypothetical protein